MTQVTFTSSGNWTCPAGVTSVDAACWAEGGNGGTGTTGTGSHSGGGGGGGEYAEETTLAVTPGNVYSFTIGGGGSGTDTSFRGDTVTVLAHHGGNGSGATAGAAGSGSTNSIHFSGGAGGAGLTHTNPGGGGGGGGAGSGGGGGNGATGVLAGSAAGGSAGSGGGGSGGNGGNASVTGVPGQAGGSAGGGGGGGSGRTAGTAGGAGSGGQIILTYVQFTEGTADLSGTGVLTAAGAISGTITASAALSGTGVFTGTARGTGSGVVNQWAASYSQPATFGTTPPALQSCPVGLNPSFQVGVGTGVPTAGNWLFAVVGWKQPYPASPVTVTVADDIRSWWRPASPSQASGNCRAVIWYTPNLALPPAWVYVAPNGAVSGITVLVVEVTGLGAWDTVTGTVTNYAGGVTSLSLSLPAP